jgi:hypothetical protein
MRADIHDGQEQKCSIHGPDTEAQDQSSPSITFDLQHTAGPYHPNRIVRINPIFKAFREQRRLPAIDPFHEALHPPPAASESLPRESHEEVRFHTARVTMRHRDGAA